MADDYDDGDDDALSKTKSVKNLRVAIGDNLGKNL